MKIVQNSCGQIEHALNHKPRKILGYKTSYEVQYTTNLSYIC